MWKPERGIGVTELQSEYGKKKEKTAFINQIQFSNGDFNSIGYVHAWIFKILREEK